jgi:surfactin synthase thioesterase subunit
MRELVEAAASSLRLAFQQRPFALFGHSMGSIAAFELARLLQRGGCSGAEMLIVAGASPPSRRPERREIWKLPDAEFIEELRIMNGTPDELLRDREAMMLLLPVIRRDLEVAESYRPEARVRVACPLVALGGTCDPDVSPEVIEKWGSHSIGEFQSHTFDGDHFFVNQNDQVTTCIAACLQPLLARLRARR